MVLDKGKGHCGVTPRALLHPPVPSPPPSPTDLIPIIKTQLLRSPAVLRGLNERPESGYKGGRHGRTRWEKPQKREAGHPRQTGPAISPPHAHGQERAEHTRRGPPSPAPRGLTFHAGSLSKVAPDTRLPRALSSSCSVSAQPRPPGNPCCLSPFAGPDLPSCLRGSPEQTDSCHKHSPWVIIKGICRDPAVPPSHDRPPRRIRGAKEGAEQGPSSEAPGSSPECALVADNPSSENEDAPLPTPGSDGRSVTPRGGTLQFLRLRCRVSIPHWHYSSLTLTK